MALYGPAVVHCKAWASALRVAWSGADMDPMFPENRKGKDLEVAQSFGQAFGRGVDFQDMLNDFPEVPSKVERGHLVKSCRPRTWHA